MNTDCACVTTTATATTPTSTARAPTVSAVRPASAVSAVTAAITAARSASWASACGNTTVGGVSSCGASSCHSNDPDPLPENVPAPYYGSFETRAWDVCNAAPFYGESFTLDNDLGLDNDGDNVYDENDTDCGASPCPEDLDGDDLIGFQDLLIILSEWGPCLSCPADIDRDGTIGFTDLLLVLAAWGDCPG